MALWLQQTCSSLFLASAEDGLPSSLIGEGVWPGLGDSNGAAPFNNKSLWLGIFVGHEIKD